MQSKGNDKMKRQPTEWEKIFAKEATNKELISKIYQQLTQLKKNKKRQPIKKWAEDLDISQKKIYRWPKHTWKDPQHLKEMQIKTTIRYHLKPVRMAIIKKSTNNKCRRECREKQTFLYCWWECKVVWPLWRTVWNFL